MDLSEPQMGEMPTGRRLVGTTFRPSLDAGQMTLLLDALSLAADEMRIAAGVNEPGSRWRRVHDAKVRQYDDLYHDLRDYMAATPSESEVA